jgi:hypothetical protein
MAAATNYYVQASELPNLLQLQNVSLTYDTTLTNANVYLPQLSTIEGNLVQIQITNIGGGTLTVIPFADGGAVPPVQDTISGATSFVFAGNSDPEFYTLKINLIQGVAVDWSIEQSLSVPVLALAKADLAAAPYTNYPVGIVVYVVDYATSGKGCSIQKISDSNGTFADWIVTATESTADTGGFGQVPA